MAQPRSKGGKFAKKQTYTCPNCGNTKYHPIIADNKIIENQKKCTNCAHVLTEE